MEMELERLRKEIAEMEARLQGRSSCSKSDSVGGSSSSDLNPLTGPDKEDTKSCHSIHHSSDDEAEELPGISL